MDISCGRTECRKDLESKHLCMKGVWHCAALCQNRKATPAYIEVAVRRNLSQHYWWEEKGLVLHD